MHKKILVMDNFPDTYGRAVKGLGKLTSDYKLFIASPNKFALVLFTGGEDVDPSLYNDTSPYNLCTSNIARDRFEKVVFKQALDNNIRMIGICRGFQFLNVMAGGRLMHHIEGHAGSIHTFDSYNLKKEIKVNSFHHQMVIPNTDAHLIGWSTNNLSDSYYGKDDQKEKWDSPEVESCIFPNINACGVQYHPEWMHETSDGFMFFYNLANRFISWPMEKMIQVYTKGNRHDRQKSNVVHTRLSNFTG